MTSQQFRLPYGVSNIDSEVVAAYLRKDTQFMDRTANAGLVSPLLDQSRQKLKWIAGDYTKGSIFHAHPAVQIRAGGTYIFRNRSANFIAGHEMVAECLTGAWGKAETKRFGNENSEDALTWNVLRSIQEAGSLQLVLELLGIPNAGECPHLYLWGRRILDDRTESWSKLQEVRDLLEPGTGQQTEPDAVIHVPGWGWIFVEAKLSSPTATYAKTPERVAEWIKRYSGHCSGAFRDQLIASIPGDEFPAQLMRNIAFAHRFCSPGENAIVVALVREEDRTPVTTWVNRCLTDDCTVRFQKLTWESVYRSLPENDPLFDTLRRYFKNKTVSLRPAFNFSPAGMAATP